VNGSGDIVAGPKGIADKGIKNVKDFGKDEGKEKPAPKQPAATTVGSTAAGEVIGKGSTGEVVRKGDRVYKNFNKPEAEAYKSMAGVVGVSPGQVEGDKIVTPHYPHVMSVDTVPLKQRHNMSAMVKQNLGRIVNAVNAVSEAGYDYNDPLQFGLDDDYQAHLIDLSMAQKGGDVTKENLHRLSDYLEQFGAGRHAGAIKQIAHVRDYLTDGGSLRDFDSTSPESLDGAKIAAHLDGKEPKYAYYSFNARFIPKVAQTGHRDGTNVVFSDTPLSDEFMSQWELNPAIHPAKREAAPSKVEKFARRFAAEVAEKYAAAEEGRWITIGGGPGEKGQEHAGGTPVKIGKGGKILAGPAALAGKDIDNLNGKKKGEDKPAPPAPPAPAPVQPKPPAAATPKPAPKLFGDSGESPDASPRDDANAAREAESADYAFARKSEFGNAGEDLLMSARHKVNAWRGLQEAEADGTAEKFVTRDQLLKAEPHDLVAAAEINPMTSLAMLKALKSLPPKPEYKKHYIRNAEEKKKNREDYLNAYRRMKATANHLAETESDPIKAIDAFNSEIYKEVVRLRQTNKYNDIANALISIAKKTGTYGDVRSDIYDLKRRNVDDSAIKSMVAGKPVAKSATDKPAGPEKFSPADAYVTHSTRVGGKDVSQMVSDPKTASANVASGFGLRGVQWGNSVTDDERKHHIKKVAESLTDMTTALGIDPADVSLGGKLGLAIGARGVGGARAHYEPDSKVINLTRKNGAGSLAHEWGHAFDHFAGGESGFATQRRSREPSPLNRATAAVASAFHSSGYSTRLTDTLQKLLNEKRIAAGMANYLNNTQEKFARAFEMHVLTKLEAAGQSNTYLTGIDKDRSLGIWPTAEEVAHMAPHFDAAMKAYTEQQRGPEKFARRFTRDEMVRYFTAEIERYSKEKKDGERWITLHPNGATPGTPVKVNGDGDIVAGPEGIAKKGIKNVADFGKKKPEGEGSKAKEPAKPATPSPAKHVSQMEYKEYKRHLAAKFVEQVNAGDSAFKSGSVRLSSDGMLQHYLGQKTGWRDAMDTDQTMLQAAYETGLPLPQKHPGWEKHLDEMSKENEEKNKQKQEIDDARKSGHEHTLGEWLNRWEATSEADKKSFGAQHKKFVAEALADGETVPPEVLADYPDLQAKQAVGGDTNKPAAAEAKPKATLNVTPVQAGKAMQFGPNAEPIEGDIAGFPITTANRGLLQKVSPRTRKDLEAALSDPETVQAMRDAGITHIHFAPHKLNSDQAKGRKWMAARTDDNGLMLHTMSGNHIANSKVPERATGGMTRVIHHEAGHGLWAHSSDEKRSALRSAVDAHPEIKSDIAKIVRIEQPDNAFDDSHQARRERPYMEVHAELNAMRKYDPERFNKLPKPLVDAVNAIGETKAAPIPEHLANLRKPEWKFARRFTAEVMERYYLRNPERYAAKTDAKPPTATAGGERWITIGGKKKGDANHHGGFRCKISGDGTILAGGPKGLRGKNVSQVHAHFQKAQNTPANRAKRVKSIINRQAKKHGMTADEYRSHATQAWAAHQEFHAGHEAAKAHARRLTGLDARDIRRFENQNLDHAADHPRLRGFDAAATEVANAFPELGWGVRDDGEMEDRTLGAELWELLKEGKQKQPSETTAEYHSVVDDFIHDRQRQARRGAKSQSPQVDLPPTDDEWDRNESFEPVGATSMFDPNEFDRFARRFSAELVEKYYRRQIEKYAEKKDNEADRWVTLENGVHVQIGSNGEIKAGPKEFAGKNISNLGEKSKTSKPADEPKSEGKKAKSTPSASKPKQSWEPIGKKALDGDTAGAIADISKLSFDELKSLASDAGMSTYKLTKAGLLKNMKLAIAAHSPEAREKARIEDQERSDFLDTRHLLETVKGGSHSPLAELPGKTEQERIVGINTGNPEIREGLRKGTLKLLRESAKKLNPYNEQHAKLLGEVGKYLPADDSGKYEPPDDSGSLDVSPSHTDAINSARATDKKFQGGGRYESEMWHKLRTKYPGSKLPKLSREGAEYVADQHEAEGKPVPPEIAAVLNGSQADSPHLPAYQQAKRRIESPQGRLMGAVQMKQDVIRAAAKHWGIDYHDAEDRLEIENQSAEKFAKRFAAEVVEKYAEKKGERWVTLHPNGATPGTPVKVNDDGDIVGGPEGIAKKGIKNLSDFGKGKGGSGNDGGKSASSSSDDDDDSDDSKHAAKWTRSNGTTIHAIKENGKLVITATTKDGKKLQKTLSANSIADFKNFPIKGGPVVRDGIEFSHNIHDIGVTRDELQRLIDMPHNQSDEHREAQRQSKIFSDHARLKSDVLSAFNNQRHAINSNWENESVHVNKTPRESQTLDDARKKLQEFEQQNPHLPPYNFFGDEPKSETPKPVAAAVDVAPVKSQSVAKSHDENRQWAAADGTIPEAKPFTDQDATSNLTGTLQDAAGRKKPIFVSGNTFAHKETIKKLGQKFGTFASWDAASKRWYFKPQFVKDHAGMAEGLRDLEKKGLRIETYRRRTTQWVAKSISDGLARRFS
jgi:hypothetical protein